jgi:uncharacterized protein YjbI with pentapeptide repeats
MVQKMKIWDYITPRKVALGILTTAFLVFMFGYHYQHPEGLNLQWLATDFYANLSTELFSIAITVLVIDSLYKYHEARSEKNRLILEMSSPDNGIAVRATQIMQREYSYLIDGSLKNKFFWSANLNGAELLSAELEGASFHFASMVGAHLYGANLKNVAFWRTNLEGVFLQDADLSDATVVFANLKNAKVTRQQLKVCRTLHGTILPNGKLYDGSFQLSGDIEDAKACGFDLNNPVAMQKWFSMSYNEFMQISDLRKEKPELTDWGFPT